MEAQGESILWRNSDNRWGWVSIVIHWLTALTVISLFIFGLWMVELTYYDKWYRTAPFIHKSIGISLLLLTLFRIAWRKMNIVPAHLASHTDLENKVTSVVHKSIYVLMLLIMFSGYLISTADGRAIDVFGLFEVPATIHGIDKQEDVAGVVHLVLAISLITMVSLHAAGALKHHFIDKDLTLKRMLGIL